jgi:hypothetical protein
MTAIETSTLVTSTVQIGDLVHPLTSTPAELATHYREQIGRVCEISSTVEDGMPSYVGIQFESHFPADEARRLGVAQSSHYVFTGWATITPKVGDRVRATRPQSGARAEWWVVANGRTGVVTGIDGEAITMRFDVPFTTNIDGLTEEWTSAGVATVAVIEQAEVSNMESNPIGLPLSIEARDSAARGLYARLCEVVNEIAEEQEFCGQFEDWCEDIGIESTRRRERTFTVYVDLEYEISSDTIATFLRREFGGDHDDVDASDVTVTSSVSMSMTLTGEDPGECDSYEVDNALDNAGYRNYSSYEITSYDED